MIQFDGETIQDSNIITRFVKHESAPERILGALATPREDGDRFIFERYGRKIIRLQGVIVGSSQTDLEERVDAFKELLGRPERPLDVDWNTATRRYTATCTKHEFDRDHYHNGFVPWTAEFTVLGGYGFNPEVIDVVDAEDITTDDDDETGDFIKDMTFTLEGSAPPAPIIEITIQDTTDDMQGIEVTNLDTLERIIVTRNIDWSAAVGKQIIIDCLQKKVTDNLETDSFVESKFYGQFPTFKAGENNIRIRSGGIINQQTSETELPYPSNGDHLDIDATADRICMGFRVPETDDTFGAFWLAVAYIGSSSGAFLEGTVNEDDDGKPDNGTDLLTFTKIHSSIPSFPVASYLKVADSGAGITLQAGKRYWLKLRMTGGVGGGSSVVINADENVQYRNGGVVLSSNGGTTYIADTNQPSFKVLFGGISRETDLTVSVRYMPRYL